MLDGGELVETYVNLRLIPSFVASVASSGAMAPAVAGKRCSRAVADSTAFRVS